MSTYYFKYGQKEIDYLTKKDKKLGAAIKEIGLIKREVNPNIYQSIIQTIIGQQISTSVQKTLTARIKEKYIPLNAITLNKASEEELRNLGLSRPKVLYIKEFSRKVVSKEIDLDSFKNLSDDEVVKILTSIKGIGPWTAEMTLLFSLEREDIFSFGDLAIKRGLMILHNLDEVTKETFEKYRKLYSPYGSVASLYLWKISSRK